VVYFFDSWCLFYLRMSQKIKCAFLLKSYMFQLKWTTSDDNCRMQSSLVRFKEGTISKMLLNIRSWLHANVVAWNKATKSIQLSFEPILVIFCANNLHITQNNRIIRAKNLQHKRLLKNTWCYLAWPTNKNVCMSIDSSMMGQFNTSNSYHTYLPWLFHSFALGSKLIHKSFQLPTSLDWLCGIMDLTLIVFVIFSFFFVFFGGGICMVD